MSCHGNHFSPSTLLRPNISHELNLCAVYLFLSFSWASSHFSCLRLPSCHRNVTITDIHYHIQFLSRLWDSNSGCQTFSIPYLLSPQYLLYLQMAAVFMSKSDRFELIQVSTLCCWYCHQGNLPLTEAAKFVASPLAAVGESFWSNTSNISWDLSSLERDSNKYNPDDDIWNCWFSWVWACQQVYADISFV